MTDARPLIDIEGVIKQYGGLRPLRIRRLIVGARDRVALAGLDGPGAEVLMHLITGASVPDEGVVRIDGRDTREIATDTEWLASLDRFGMVTARAVLMGPLPIEQNLVLPLTLSIDPMAPDIRATMERLADEVGLPRGRLTAAASTLSAEELVRVHLARALATRPALLLLEHPTAAVEDASEREALGRTLRGAAEGFGIGWLAVTSDPDFVRGSAATQLTLKPATGEVTGDGGWWRRLIG